MHSWRMASCWALVIFLGTKHQDESRIDSLKDVDSLLKKVTSSYKSVKTLDQVISEQFQDQVHPDKSSVSKERLEYKKPHHFHIERNIKGNQPELIVITNGITVWTYYRIAKRYRAGNYDAMNIDLNQKPFEDFLIDPGNSILDGVLKLAKIRPMGDFTVKHEMVANVECDVLEWTTGRSGSQTIDQYFFGPDGFLRQLIQENWKEGKLLNRTDMTVIQQQVDKPISNAEFSFTPPKDARK